jgi:hypothetical protein
MYESALYEGVSDGEDPKMAGERVHWSLPSCGCKAGQRWRSLISFAVLGREV